MPTSLLTRTKKTKQKADIVHFTERQIVWDLWRLEGKTSTGKLTALSDVSGKTDVNMLESPSIIRSLGANTQQQLCTPSAHPQSSNCFFKYELKEWICLKGEMLILENDESEISKCIFLQPCALPSRFIIIIPKLLYRNFLCKRKSHVWLIR